MRIRYTHIESFGVHFLFFKGILKDFLVMPIDKERTKQYNGKETLYF